MLRNVCTKESLPTCVQGWLGVVYISVSPCKWDRIEKAVLEDD